MSDLGEEKKEVMFFDGFCDGGAASTGANAECDCIRMYYYSGLPRLAVGNGGRIVMGVPEEVGEFLKLVFPRGIWLDGGISLIKLYGWMNGLHVRLEEMEISSGGVKTLAVLPGAVIQGGEGGCICGLDALLLHMMLRVSGRHGGQNYAENYVEYVGFSPDFDLSDFPFWNRNDWVVGAACRALGERLLRYTLWNYDRCYTNFTAKNKLRGETAAESSSYMITLLSPLNFIANFVYRSIILRINQQTSRLSSLSADFTLFLLICHTIFSELLHQSPDGRLTRGRLTQNRRLQQLSFNIDDEEETTDDDVNSAKLFSLLELLSAEKSGDDGQLLQVKAHLMTCCTLVVYAVLLLICIPQHLTPWAEEEMGTQGKISAAETAKSSHQRNNSVLPPVLHRLLSSLNQLIKNGWLWWWTRFSGCWTSNGQKNFAAYHFRRHDFVGVDAAPLLSEVRQMLPAVIQRLAAESTQFSSKNQPKTTPLISLPIYNTDELRRITRRQQQCSQWTDSNCNSGESDVTLLRTAGAADDRHCSTFSPLRIYQYISDNLFSANFCFLSFCAVSAVAIIMKHKVSL